MLHRASRPLRSWPAPAYKLCAWVMVAKSVCFSLGLRLEVVNHRQSRIWPPAVAAPLAHYSGDTRVVLALSASSEGLQYMLTACMSSHQRSAA